MSSAAEALDPRPVLYVLGSLLVVLAGAMIAPLLLDLAKDNEDWMGFGAAAALTLFFGVLLVFMNRSDEVRLSLRQTFIVTTTAWVVIAAFGALPFVFTSARLTYTDAFFETMSGLTTTGSTVIVGLDRTEEGVLLWRALLQWLGGIGIVGIGMAVLPFLRVGGMQLFRAESSDKSEKVVAKVGDLANQLIMLYVGVTIVAIVALMLAGMGLFDAVCHALTAIATGGYSTKDSSAGAFDLPFVHWVLLLTMLAGGLPLVRLLSFAKGDFSSIWKDSQVRFYLALLALVSITLGLWHMMEHHVPFEQAIRESAFTVVSIVTTTGFVVTDYTAWGGFAVSAIFVLTFIGGCTGSTAGGIKIFRFEILAIALKMQLQRMFSPHRVMPLRYNGRRFDMEVMLSVMGFLFVYFGAMLMMTLVLGLLGLDFVTAVSGVATAVGNVGPGLGPIIGPSGTFAPLPDAAKWVLAFAMMIGRLEFFTVLVLLAPAFWRP
jgi:trk system potassium uptake protein TrkH